MGDSEQTARTMLASDFAALPDLIRAHARERGDKPALIFGDRIVTYAALDRMMDRIVFSLQRDGAKQGEAIAILGPNSLEYALVFLGALRAGCVAAPLAPSATPEQLAAMVADSGAPILFHGAAHDIPVPVHKVALERLDDWLGDGIPAPATVTPEDPFNIIYSSGTTGTPKGIVQPHAMRWIHISRAPPGFDEAVTMVATPLYSNTTLVSVFPTLGSRPRSIAATSPCSCRSNISGSWRIPNSTASIFPASSSRPAPARPSPPRSRPIFSRAGRGCSSNITG
jgi:acyl-CoA synthetase (AMP-forming)/AMP-acid ligase II